MRAKTTALILALLVAAVSYGMALRTASARKVAAAARIEEEVPRLGRPEEDFVSSRTCRGCHPSEYASWHASYHRTMTQIATPEAVVGRFDGVTLESGGRTYRLEQDGDELWVDMVDPDWERQQRLDGVDPDSVPDPPRARRQVVMTTGSHHMQTYWVSSEHGREVFNLPFVFLFEQDRWVPRESVFLRPPEASRFFAMWNNSCIDCHSTAGKVGFDFQEEVFESAVAEMGIACEACHGPAEEHVEANRNPLRRYQLHFADEGDPTIVQPERLASREASAVCGQCHGVALSDEMDWLANGYRFRPGESLEDSRYMVRPAVDVGSERLQELTVRDPTAIPSRFWSDGMVRVSGRELSGMMESGCYERGELSCLSCHAQHDSDPDDQLAAGMETDEACLQCHASLSNDLAAHTHHAASSAGSRCYNCHMPHTTYGLLTAMRSHWIDSPTVKSSVETGRPNACNLCHLDQTLAWTSEHLTRWYGAAPVDLSPPQHRVSAALLWLLAGDAGQRALIAWGMGWEPALEASGRTWLAPYLGHLLKDPYDAVRYIAARSLRRQADYAWLEYDFLMPAAERDAARRKVIDYWVGLPLDVLDRTGPQILIDEGGNLNNEILKQLSLRRDDRPVFLAE